MVGRKPSTLSSIPFVAAKAHRHTVACKFSPYVASIE